MNWRAAALTLALLAGASHAARADDTAPDKASAQALFEDALKLLADKNFAAACPKLEESQRLDPAMGTQYRLAQCYEGLGRTASAWANYLEVADLAKAGGKSDREKAARERASAVESSLSRLTLIVATPDVPGLEVRRGAEIVGAGQWGTPVPVDPALYDIRATAPGKTPWHGTVTVAGDGTSATLTVPPLEDAPAASKSEPPPSPVAPPPPSSAPPPAPLAPPPPRPSTPTGPLATVAFVAAGVGVAGLGVGTVAGIMALSKKSEAEGLCSTQCTSLDGVNKWHDAATTGNVSTVALIVGGTAMLGAAVIWFTAPRASASVKVGLGVGNLEFTGTW
jgi:serine/threonine-protein kinase